MSAPLTDETITDAMIEALRLEADAHSDWQLSEICLRALTLAWPFSAADRQRCADAINEARARSGEHPVAPARQDPPLGTRPSDMSLLAAADALMDAVSDCESDARRARASGDESGEQYDRERAMGLRAVAVWLREIA